MADSHLTDDSEMRQLREEMAKLFDRALQIGRRQGAAAVRAAIQDAMAGAADPAGKAQQSSRTDFVLSMPEAMKVIPPQDGRARSGSVQDAVVEVLTRVGGPLLPLGIVEAGRQLGHDLKASSVRMALSVLQPRGVVEKDARGAYAIAAGPKADAGEAADAETHNT